MSCLLMLLSAGAQALVPLRSQPSGVAWPTRDWESGPLPEAFDSAALTKLLDAVDRDDPDLGQTRAVVIVWNGRLVAERYAKDFTAGTRLISWSVAKSITQALVGVAVGERLVDIDQPLGYSGWLPGDPHAAISWRQWLNMVDGENYHEIGVKNPAENDASRMLFGEGRMNVAAYAAALPIIHPPGTVWNYNTAGIILVDEALGRAIAPDAADPRLRREAMAKFMKEKLFSLIGMNSAVAEYDSTGTFAGGALVYATARDFAKFGYLYLRDGVWEDRRILPAGWVDFARSKTPADNCDVYGAGWWRIASEGEGKPYRNPIPDGPKDVFMARGYDGQLIAVVPSKDLVLVRLGRFHDPDRGSSALGRWSGDIINLFPERAP